MKPDTSTSTSFDRAKILLFKFLAHQIHPFAYAVNTFLQPALDDCQALLRHHPQDAFNVLLSLTQTFIRFAPDAELIYDDIQQFANKLKKAIDQCSLLLDADVVRESSPLLESIHLSLNGIIRQQNTDQTNYTDLYKNMSAVLNNLDKVNSLPTEMQNLLLNGALETTAVIQKPAKREISVDTNGHYRENGSTYAEKPSPSSVLPPSHSPQHHITPTTTSVINRLMDHRKSLSVSSAPVPTATAYSNGYEVTDTMSQPSKKATACIAAFPPRQNTALFPAYANDIVNGRHNATDRSYFSSQSSVASGDERIDDYERELATPTPSNEGDLQLHGGPRPGTALSSVYDDDGWDEQKSREYYSNSRFTDPIAASHDWQPARGHLSIVKEQSHLDLTTAISYSHVTDTYMQEFGNKTTRPALRGDLIMNYGTPQSGPQATCLPIGIGLSYDELTLLSCDVHRSSQNIRLFDIQSGRLKHTITSNPQMKFHRPSAVMSNARNNILIVERDSICITEPDGRLIQTIGHRSIKQLYGIAMFRDRYLLTIDSKATDNQTAENSRLLLFDPDSGQLVYEQRIGINQESEDALKKHANHRIKGHILPETNTKPRFLAVHNDQIYIADLGRSLIYGTSIRNHFDFHCTTVFGGHGRANGEMNDPSGLFIDSGGNVISADSKNDRIQVFSSDGDYRTTLKLNERIKRPSGICTNRAGTHVYVSCYLAGCVRAFNVTY